MFSKSTVLGLIAAAACAVPVVAQVNHFHPPQTLGSGFYCSDDQFFFYNGGFTRWTQVGHHDWVFSFGNTDDGFGKVGLRLDAAFRKGNVMFTYLNVDNANDPHLVVFGQYGDGRSGVYFRSGIASGDGNNLTRNGNNFTFHTSTFFDSSFRIRNVWIYDEGFDDPVSGERLKNVSIGDVPIVPAMVKTLYDCTPADDDFPTPD